MKVLLVAPQPFYVERGTPIAVSLLANTLVTLGHEVDLLVFHEGMDIAATPGLRLFRARRPPGVKHVPIGISWQKLACDLSLIASMARLLIGGRYDVVHAVEEAVFPAALFNLFSSRRLVYDMDSSLADELTDKWTALRPLRGLLTMFERMVVRRATVVLPVCEDLAAKVRPWLGADRVVVLPDVPVGDMTPLVAGESLRAIVGDGPLIGLYVGNLEHYQGIDLLLDALALVRAGVPLALVVIGGAAADVERYRGRVHELGLADRAFFLGPRPLSQLNAYLAQADVLVSPRILGQNTPMKVYSYMQSGKAILATDIRSHTQALGPDCAELVPPVAAAMASGLERLAGDGAARERLGATARDKAEREYSLQAYRSRVERAYQKLARG